MEYRREIDGLRAVAVVPVILFHAGLQAFSGGFVGVDVFFVISGYLITTIILSEKERGTFSIVNFYERRIRRILPALFLVMLVSLPFAWLWLLPSDMRAFAQSLTAVSTFSSNIFFWMTSGYWGTANELVPLLHTWSLAVEEQYYVIFPLFLMLMWSFRRRWILSSFLVIAIISLLAAHWGAYHHPTATFFLLVTRAWELAIGASIAFYFLYRKVGALALPQHRYAYEVLSVIGLLMIGYAVFMFDETVPFPSFYTLVPTAGTGLIILFCSPKTIIGRLLGLKLFVGIGLISYSAYLWHQPLLAFARYRSMTSPSTVLLVALATLSLLLAYLSWRYVEKPFREKGRYNRKTIFTFAAAGSIAFVAIGLAGSLSGGWPNRIDAKLQSLIDTANTKNPGEQSCLGKTVRDISAKQSCTLVANDRIFAYLMGDSHAATISSALKGAFEKTDIGLIQATERGCPPVQGVYVYVTDKFRCFRHNEDVYRYLSESPEIRYVIVVARWQFYIEAERFDNSEGGIEPTEVIHFESAINDRLDYPPGQSNAAKFGAAYTDSVKKLVAMGKKVILVYSIPEAGWDVPRYVRNYYLHSPGDAFAPGTGSTSYKVFQDRNKSAYQALDSVGKYPNLSRVYPEKVFCNADLEHRCIVQKNDNLLYRDDDHLSDAGAMLVVRQIMDHLN